MPEKKPPLLDRLLDALVGFQRRHYLVILLFGLGLSGLCAKRAVKLLSTVATELIHLLPEHYPSVQLSDQIKSKFNRRSSLYVIVNSPSAEANERAVKDLKNVLEDIDGVDYAEIEKKGYDFIDKNKLMLVDLEELEKARDKLDRRIQKEKLGGMYIDLEEDENAGKKDDESFDALIQSYKDKYTQGVQSRFRRNKDGTVYVVDVYPESTDGSLKFFKRFGQTVDERLKTFDFKSYHPEMTFGYAGAIKTRVDQYDALIRDLKIGGAVSLVSIFAVLYLYFAGYIRRAPGAAGFLKAALVRFVPVALIFVPMIFSTLIAFCFCSFFFSQLNVVTSFLFAIIFGLGVDIGIHLMTRYIQDRLRGLESVHAHRDIVLRTGKSAITSVLTTVASFYILTVNDFRGFSEFGWIAGNGLVIALLCYLLFQPCLILLMDHWHLLGRETFSQVSFHEPKRRDIPFAKPLLAFCLVLAAVSAALITRVPFEWDFNKLKMKIAEREEQKSLLRETINRVNSPASYIVESEAEARALEAALKQRRTAEGDKSTIQFVSSYYALFPPDQDKKLSLLAEIDRLLADDALNGVAENERKTIDEVRDMIAETKRVAEKDIPPEVAEVFWGNTGDRSSSVVYVMPRAELELDNGINAREFFEDVGEISLAGKTFHAVSDSIVFAQVLVTLFRDSKIAITLSAALLTLLVALHFRDARKTAFVLGGLSCGIFWMFSLMEMFGLKLNFYNMIVIPAMIGMGEDNSVHLLDRYEEENRSSIVKVLKTSGGAAFMASLTTILGYAGLCFTRHPGLQSIGWMAVTGMTTCTLGSMVVLPLLLQIFLKPGPLPAAAPAPLNA